MPPRILLGLVACLMVLSATIRAQDKDNPPAKPAAKGKAKSDIVPGYEQRTMEGFFLLINRKALSEIENSKGKFEIEPLDVLESELKALNAILLPKILKAMQTVRIFIEWDDQPNGMKLNLGDQQPNGRVVAVYRSGSPLRAAQEGKIHPLKMNAVEVMTLKTLTEMHQPGRNKDQIILLHELCHCVHHVFLGYENQEVRKTYQQAMDRDLYAKSYAKTSEAEYFAEISSAYLDRCNFEPHTAEELKSHDPTGYQLMEKVWGKQDVIAKARDKAAKEREAKLKQRPRSSATASTNGKKSDDKPGTTSAPDAEKTATTKLNMAKESLKDGRTERARERLEELVKQFPETAAGQEAARMLKELK